MANPPAPLTGIELLLQTALQHFLRGESEQAMARVDDAVAAATDNDQLLGAATLLLRFGHSARAVEVFRAMLVRDPGSVTAHANIARLQSEHDPGDIASMVALADALDPESTFGIQLSFALGKAFADLGDFDRSFACYASANAGRRTQVEFPLPAFRRRLQRLRMEFRPALFDRLAGGGVTGFKPIFVVGMPRSGSTLAEQILASHPKVYGGGELPVMADVTAAARRKHFRTSVADLVSVATPAWISEMARQYIGAVRPLMGRKPRLVDKYLDNFWNVGLIRLMFPDARVIHCVRDPLDNGMSIFRQHFDSNGPDFAYDLGEIGAYFRMHDSLMQHWHEVLPGFVQPLSYEAMVEDLEGTARRLVAFCDLPWDDRCLAFHQTERAVKTASHAQVRRPLYRDAIGSAQPYLPHLGPLIEALGAR